MHRFFNIVRKEYAVASRRVGLWVMGIVLILFYTGTEITPFLQGNATVIPADWIWRQASFVVFQMNLFFPLVGGILAADRLSRDYRLGVDELRESTPVSRGRFLLAKYLGVVGSWAVPQVIALLLVGLVPMLGGLVGWFYLAAVLLCGLAISLPALLFVTAFSLACPMVMPVRVYQVLFTGYWFWGNFLSSQVFPTVSDTLLNASGIYAMQGFFGTSFGTAAPTYTASQAVMNIGILLLLGAAVLLVLNFFLTRRVQKA